MENRIRELRKQRGLTMKQLGALVGLGESTISQYENGKRQPDNETLLKLSACFGVTVGFLLGAEPESGAGTAKRPATRAELQAAFWGGDQDLTQEEMDELWDDVAEYAAFKAAQKKREKHD